MTKSKQTKDGENMRNRNEAEVTEENKTSKQTVKRNEAKSAVKAFLETKPEIPADVLEHIKFLAGMGARSQGMQIANALKEMLVAGPVSAVDIFTKFGYGQPTMIKKIKDFIKAAPEHRIWVSFVDGNYVIQGSGEDAPDGWEGYVPLVNTEL